MRLRRRYVFLISSFVILLVAGFFITAQDLKEPPLERLKEAVAALDSARRAQAGNVTPVLLDSASLLLANGQSELSAVNASWWPFQSYAIADSLLAESIKLSHQSIHSSGHSRKLQSDHVTARYTKLKDSLTIWQEILDRSLPRTEELSLYRSAVVNLELCENMLKHNQYESAISYIDTATRTLDRLNERYFDHAAAAEHWLTKGAEWSAQTVENSRAKKSTALLVDKRRHFLYVVQSGKVVDSMRCDLGYNSGHQKRLSGDGATPEGMYRVTKVNRASKYYRALLLNYPNKDDQARFESNRSLGVIPTDAEVGGLIEVHGHGGVGKDWTDGCVAVTDRQMDALLRIAGEGTQVTIVREWTNR